MGYYDDLLGGKPRSLPPLGGLPKRPRMFDDLLTGKPRTVAPPPPEPEERSMFGDLLSAAKDYVTPANALRIGLPVLGGVVGSVLPGPGTAAGAAIGGALGAGIGGAVGEVAAEKLEGREIDAGEVALAGGLSMIPAGPFGRLAAKPGLNLLGRGALHVAEGATQGALDVGASSLYREGRLPTPDELKSGLAGGAVLGGAIGTGAEKLLRRPAPRPAADALPAELPPLRAGETRATESTATSYTPEAQFIPEVPYGQVPIRTGVPPAGVNGGVGPSSPPAPLPPGPKGTEALTEGLRIGQQNKALAEAQAAEPIDPVQTVLEPPLAGPETGAEAGPATLPPIGSPEIPPAPRRVEFPIGPSKTKMKTTPKTVDPAGQALIDRQVQLLIESGQADNPLLPIEVQQAVRKALQARQEPPGAIEPPVNEVQAPIAPESPVGEATANAPVERRGKVRLLPDRKAIADRLKLPEDHPGVAEVMDLQTQARVDPTTGLGNKRYWEEIQQSLGPDDHTVMADLQKFKPVNDTYGHEAGDLVLRHVGDVFKRHFGEETARFGGDEFGGVVRGMSREDAQARMEAYREELSQTVVQVEMPDGRRVDLPGIQAHIGVGKDAREADLAVNAAAADSRKGGRGAVPAEPVPPPGSPRGPEGGGEGGGGAAPAQELAPGPTKPKKQRLSNKPLDLPKDELGQPIFPGQEGMSANERMAVRQVAQALVDEVSFGNEARPPRGKIFVKDRATGAATDEVIGVKSAKTGTPLEDLPYTPPQMKRALEIDKGNPIEGDILAAAANDPRVEDALAYIESPKIGGPGDEPFDAQFAVRPAPGQRGFEGIKDDVASAREKAKAPEQASMFGGEMLQGVERHVPEGREADGPLFSRPEAPKAKQERLKVDLERVGKEIAAQQDREVIESRRKVPFDSIQGQKYHLADLLDRKKRIDAVLQAKARGYESKYTPEQLDKFASERTTLEATIRDTEEHVRFLEKLDIDDDVVPGEAVGLYATSKSPRPESAPSNSGAIAKTAPETGDQSLRQRIAEVFPKLKAEEVENGFVLPTRSGRRIWVSEVGEIHFDPKMAAKGHGSKAAERLSKGELRIAGSTETLGINSVIKLADKGVLPHELAHVVKDHFATPRENAMIDRRFGPEAKKQGRKVDEVWADWHNQWFDNGGPRKPARNFLEAVSHRIHDFFEKIAYAIRPTAEGLSRRIASGEVLERAEQPKARPAEPKASVQPIKAKPIPNKPKAVSEHEKLFERVSKELKEPSHEFKDRFFRTDPADRRAIEALIRAERHPTLKDKAYELWLNGILSGVKTQGGNVVGNTMTQGLRVAEKAVAGAIDATRAVLTGSERERFIGEAFADLRGVPEGLKKALHVLKAGIRNESFGEGKVEHQVGAIGGKTGEIVRLPTRLLSAFDDAFKALAETRESYSQAYRKARKEGKSGGELGARVQDILDNLDRHPDILDAMKSEASYQTFTKELGPAGQKAMEFRDAVGPAKWIVPFMKTPINIGKYTLERTPLNFLKLAADYHAGKIKGGELSSEMAKPLLGTILGMAFAYAAHEGVITGGGPADEKKRNLLRATGWSPYSIKAGKKYYSFERFEPLASVAGFAADLVEAKDEDKQRDLVNKIVGSAMENLLNQGYIQGASNMILAASDPTRFAGQWARSFQGSLVPAIVGAAAQAVDPTVRKTDPLDGSAILARVPFASLMLEPVRRGTGETIQRDNPILNALSPSQVSNEKGSEKDLERALLAADFVPSGPSRTISVNGVKVELNDDQYRVLQRADEQATKYLRKVVTSQRFRTMPPESRKRFLRSIYERYSDAARANIKREKAFRKAYQQARAS